MGSSPESAADPASDPARRPRSDPEPALDVLRRGVDSYAPWLRPDGELDDPVFGEPTQYGTAYHAYGNAALAELESELESELGEAARSAEHADRAARGLAAALRHTGDPSLPPAGSGFARDSGAVTRGNHRDFTWPPILSAYRILQRLDALPGAPGEVEQRIAAVDVEASFSSRPPSNWSSVWLSGEWLRIRMGLSPWTVEEFDGWLTPFFEGNPERGEPARVDVERGFFAEPGLPNSYDLFTRFHLARLTAEGYAGRWLGELRRLERTGLERSRRVQLSDGSLASAHRSAGQAWTLGAQVAFLTGLGEYGAARRAFEALRLLQRASGPFSPVQNVLPPSWRVGYEGYTADAHYGNLALGFLATAALEGFTGREPLDSRDSAGGVRLLEGVASSAGQRGRPEAGALRWADLARAVVNVGPYSVAVEAAPAPAYDALGITDLTVGPGRRLQLASSARSLATGRFVNPGWDLRFAEGSGAIAAEGILGVRLTAHTVQGRAYRLIVHATASGVEVTETLEPASDEAARPEPPALLVPYPRDLGTGTTTRVTRTERGILLTYADERLALDLAEPAKLTRVTVLEDGFENRRGRCGLVRLELELAPSSSTFTWTLARADT